MDTLYKRNPEAPEVAANKLFPTSKLFLFFFSQYLVAYTWLTRPSHGKKAGSWSQVTSPVLILIFRHSFQLTVWIGMDLHLLMTTLMQLLRPSFTIKSAELCALYDRPS